jgi:hypothetical protein
MQARTRKERQKLTRLNKARDKTEVKTQRKRNEERKSRRKETESKAVLIQNKFETLVTCHKAHVTHDTKATSGGSCLYYTSWTTNPLLLFRRHPVILRTLLDLLNQLQRLYNISQDGKATENGQHIGNCNEETAAHFEV